VVLKLQSLSQGPNRWAYSQGQAFSRQHQLVLLRFQSHLLGGLFAEVKESPNQVAQFRPLSVIRKGQSFFDGRHFGMYISYNDISW
jgi:hypothetical protein